MQNGDAYATLHEPGQQLLRPPARPPLMTRSCRLAPEPDDAVQARAAAAEYRAWSEAGRPGAVPQAEARRLLLGNPG
jgi:hypothetical protein